MRRPNAVHLKVIEMLLTLPAARQGAIIDARSCAPPDMDAADSCGHPNKAALGPNASVVESTDLDQAFCQALTTPNGD